MTSLIDVIFLLLLFFMLSSTFSRFAEVEIAISGASANATQPSDTRMLFLRLTENGMTLNGTPVSSQDLAQAVQTHTTDTSDTEATVLVSVTGRASAQALTDALVALRSVQGLSISVLEAA